VRLLFTPDAAPLPAEEICHYLPLRRMPFICRCVTPAAMMLMPD